MDYKYSEGQMVIARLANYDSETTVGEAEIVYIDPHDSRLPYRLVTNKNTPEEDYYWASEQDIVGEVGEKLQETSPLLAMEVTTLPELFQFLGEILIEYKNVVAAQPHDFRGTLFVDEFYDIFDALIEGETLRALSLVPDMKKAIQYEMGRAERETKAKQERIRQLREELARLEGK